MRVAILQVRFDSESRARTVQNLMRSVDAAANSNTPVDLLILPGGCDLCGAEDATNISSSILESQAENLAAKAREWGVFIAAGLTRWRGDVLKSYSVLFDPNADAVLRDGEADGGCAEDVPLWKTAVGPIGIVEASVGESFSTRVAGVNAPAVVAVCASSSFLLKSPTSAVGVREACLAGSASSTAHWGVVFPVEEGGSTSANAGHSFLCGPGGAVIVESSDAGETVLFADVPLEYS